MPPEATAYDAINCGSFETGFQEVCNRCFNTELASRIGFDEFEHVNFEPVRLVDCAGNPHVFHFTTHLFGTGVSLDAFEVRAGEFRWAYGSPKVMKVAAAP